MAYCSFWCHQLILGQFCAERCSRMAGTDQFPGSKPGSKAPLKSKHDPNAAPRSLLSFGEELDNDEATSTAFSMAKNPHRRSVRCCQLQQ